MRFSHWLRPLAARLFRTPIGRGTGYLAFRPRVEGLEDRSVPAVFMVTNTDDVAAGSLRHAILEANAAPGADEIRFALPDALKSPGTDWWRIQPTSALPAITGTVTLDGWSQGGAGYHGPPRVMVDGSMAGLVDGLQVQANDCLIRGLAVGNFDPTAIVGNNGIRLEANFSIVQGCYIGLDPSGSVVPNCFGLNDTGIQNLIGGSGPGEGNVIGGSRGWQILSRNGATIRGNLIGTDPTGTAVISTSANGINVGGVSPTGVPLVVEGNVISGSAGPGILVTAGGVRIRSNLIGTDVTGMYALGNAQGGIFVQSGGADLVIGGTGTANPVANLQSHYDHIRNVTGGDRNVISANRDYGIRIQSAGVIVQGNYIGTNAAGEVAAGLGNGFNTSGGGIGMGDGNVIGGPGAGEGNLIAGNNGSGIDIVGSAGNFIRGNVIRENFGAGVTVGAQNPAGSASNTISENSIYGNGGLGIDLMNGPGGTGVNLNDLLGHVGSNRFQNFPDLTAVSPTVGGITVTGTLTQASTPDTAFRLEFFANTAQGDLGPDGFHYGEGKRFLGSIDITTNASGVAPISHDLPALLVSEGYVTATATNLATGDTSEFSRSIAPPANQVPVAHPGGPYAIQEGGSLTLDASGSSDPDPLTYSWDVNGDGVFGDSSGVTPTLTWSELLALGVADGPFTTSNLRVQVSDGFNPAVTSAATTLAVSNVPPSVTISGPPSAVRGQVVQFVGSFTDPGPDTWTATVEYGDGTEVQAVSLNADNTFALSHAYAATGTYTVTVNVTDDDGGVGISTQQVAVRVMDLQPIPGDPTHTSLVVGGSEGNDVIVFTPGLFANQVVATVLSPVPGGLELTVGVFRTSAQGCELAIQVGGVAVTVQSVPLSSPLARLVAYGNGGADDITVAGSLGQSAWLYGGTGNDRIKGGGGNNVLVGGTGDDLLVGGNDRDILIGGTGADRLVGNAADDVLVSGSTAFDGTEAALAAVLAEWTSTRSYAARVANLTGTGTGTGTRLNGDTFLRVTTSATTTTVFDDGAADVLTGTSGQDWFFANLAGPGVLDRVTDLSAAEFANDLTFILN